MILAADVGNTSISLGIFENGQLISRAKLASDRSKTADEYAVLLAGIFGMKKLNFESLGGAMLLSVVPQLTHTISEALREFGIDPLIVGAGIKTGLNIRVENPSHLGSDIVADTVGAMRLAKPPLVVIDLGTATTLTAINPRGELCGCIIAPGVKLSLDALSKSCAMLPDVPIAKPSKLLGTNTAESMNSGSVLGSALMLDGFIDSIKAEFPGSELSVIATGGLSELIVPLCKSNIRREPDLTLKGLCRLWEINQKQKKPREDQNAI